MKKKAIKLATATAIAASAFVAVAPTQSEAATNSVDKAITKATNQMAKAYDTYHKAAKNEGKLPATGTIRNQVKLANDYYDAATKEIAKNGGSKTKKAAYTKKLNDKKYFLDRAEAYLAAVNTNLNPAKTAFNEAVKGGKQKTVLAAQKAYNDAIEGFEAKVDKIYGPDARNLLKAKYAAPAHKLADSVNDEMKVYNAYKDIEQKDLIGKDLAAANETIQGVKELADKIAKLDTALAKNITKAVVKNNEAFEKAVKATVTIEGITDGEKTEEETKTITVKAIKGSEIKVTLNGTAVAANENGSYTLKLQEGSNKVAVESTVYGVKTELNKEITSNQTPVVKSVSAINAKEIVVTFNKAVSTNSVATTDFTVTATGTNTANAVVDVKLAENGKSAILLLTSAVPDAGVDVEIADGAILTSGFDKFPKSTTKAVKVEDATAPKLVSAVAKDSTTVELTFDEQVDWTTNLGGVSVNGNTLVAGANSTKAGDYTYTFTVPTLKSGANTVQVLNYADFSANKEALTTTSVNYNADVSTPAVASIKGEDSNSFILTLNKSVDTIVPSNFTVKKGNYTFTSTDLTVSYVDADGNPTASAGTTPSKYVKVVVPTQATSANPLYGTNETSVALSVAVSGYKNGTVIGSEYSGSVTLSKDLAAPKVVSSKLITYDKGAKTITVPFDKTLTLVDVSKLTVVSGTVKVAATPTVNGKNLVITIDDTAGLTDGKYSLVLDKGLVKDGSNNVNEATTLTTEVTNAASTLQLSGSIFNTTAVNESGKNVITVSYGTKVNDAAASTSSYSLNGAGLPSGSVAYFTTTAKDTVKIELPASYSVALNDLSAKITLNANAVKEYATGKVVSSSATEVKAIDQVITLKDNVKPTVSKVDYVKDANGLATGLKLTFSESVDTGVVADLTDDFVIKTGSTEIAYAVAAPSTGDTATDNVVILNFSSASTAASGVTIATNSDSNKIDLADISTYNKVASFNVSAQ